MVLIKILFGLVVFLQYLSLAKLMDEFEMNPHSHHLKNGVRGTLISVIISTVAFIILLSF